MFGHCISCRQLSLKMQENNAQGFTLLEIICALTIMGLVTLAALAFLGQSFRIWESSAKWGENERCVRLVTRKFEEFTGCLYTGPFPHGETQGFAGRDIEVSGWIEIDNGLSLAGIKWDANTHALIYWEDKDGSRVETKVATEVDSFEIGYINEGQSMVSVWETQQPLPVAMRWQWSYRKKKMPSVMLSVHGGQQIPVP